MTKTQMPKNNERTLRPEDVGFTDYSGLYQSKAHKGITHVRFDKITPTLDRMRNANMAWTPKPHNSNALYTVKFYDRTTNDWYNNTPFPINSDSDLEKIMMGSYKKL